MDAVDLIKTCLETGGDELVHYDNIDRPAHITVRTGPTYDVRGSYNLNLDSVVVLAHNRWNNDLDRWDGSHEEYTIFKFDKGLGIAYSTGWYGPTFGENKYDIEIQESHDWDMFFNMVLTENLRQKLEDSAGTLDDDLAEIILLNKECN